MEKNAVQMQPSVSSFILVIFQEGYTKAYPEEWTKTIRVQSFITKNFSNVQLFIPANYQMEVIQ